MTLDEFGKRLDVVAQLPLGERIAAAEAVFIGLISDRFGGETLDEALAGEVALFLAPFHELYRSRIDTIFPNLVDGSEVDQ